MNISQEKKDHIFLTALRKKNELDERIIKEKLPFEGTLRTIYFAYHKIFIRCVACDYLTRKGKLI